MKRKRKKAKPLVAKCSEERILKLSNDVSENMASGTVGEWRAVALYFRNELDKLYRVRMSLAALNIAEDMRACALREVAAWLKATERPMG